MDALEQNDIEEARSTAPEEKLRQALELMSMGFRLKLAALRREHPAAPEDEIERLFSAWLLADD